MTWEVGKRYKTRGGWEATLVAKDLRGDSEPLLFVHHKELKDAEMRHYANGEYYIKKQPESPYDILPPAPPPPQLTATDLVMRRTVVRVDGRIGLFSCDFKHKRIGCGVSFYLLNSTLIGEYCIPPPTIPEGWEPEWRPLSEVDLTR